MNLTLDRSFPPAGWTLCFAAAVCAAAALGGPGAVAAPPDADGKESVQEAGDGSPKETALDRYIRAPDANFRWKLVDTVEDERATTYIVDLVSQAWLTTDEVDRPLWRHWLVVVRPRAAKSSTALLYIGGGRNGGEPPRGAADELRQAALATSSVAVQLGTVPNQPLTFHGDGQPRFEDDLIAYCWNEYFKSEDPKWAPRLPMVKSAVRAMDATQQLLAKQAAPLEIAKFVVAGGSKRGWTTWMTAAVDPRVCGIAPIVIDVLNVKPSMKHHHAAYGFWAPAIKDYVRHKIVDRQDSPQYDRLLQLVDPYAYRSRFTMPKCLINASGDEFFLPDSSRFYFDALPEEKHLCYVPNANHSLRDTNAWETLVAFHYCLVHNVPRPQCDWTASTPGRLRLRVTRGAPRRVLLWQANNVDARDFRVESIGRAYRSRDLQADSKGEYSADIARPERGWSAYFAQLEFDVGAGTPLRLTTPVQVIPDTLPFK